MVLQHADLFDLVPHRYPINLIDRVLSIEPGVSLEAIKCVTGTDPCYAALGEGINVSKTAYPYSLILESCGQAAAVLWMHTVKVATPDMNDVLMFGSAKDVVFEADAFPGDTLVHRVKIERTVSNTIFFTGETWVESTRIVQLGWIAAIARPSTVLGR